jgi:hypothetical protein
MALMVTATTRWQRSRLTDVAAFAYRIVAIRDRKAARFVDLPRAHRKVDRCGAKTENRFFMILSS